MENNHSNTETEQTANRATPESNDSWRDGLYKNQRLMLPTIVLIMLLIALAFSLGRFVGDRHPSRVGLINSLETAKFDRPMFGSLHGGKQLRGDRHLSGTHLLGSITAINGNNLTVHNSTKDQTIVIADSTSIYKNRAIAKQTDLKVGDIINVIGQPNSNGQIMANRIQIQ